MTKTEAKEFIEKYERCVRNIMRAMNCDREKAEIAYREIFVERRLLSC